MYAITGITGQVGGEVARTLLKNKLPIRAIVRSQAKGEAWRQRGCEIALADLNEEDALASAMKGTEATFILLPSNFDPKPGFPEARHLASSILSAIERAKPKRVVYVSTIGAQASQENLLTQHTIAETTLANSSVPITFLRPAWFMENSSWDIEPAQKDGVVPSFLQPLDKKVPMVATADIGELAANLLQEKWNGHRVVELEGPRRISPNEIAMIFSELLHKKVTMQVVPRASWATLFVSQGMKNPLPRIQMLDGFNDGWIDFENKERELRQGRRELKTVLEALINRKGN